MKYYKDHYDVIVIGGALALVGLYVLVSKLVMRKGGAA